MQLILPAMSPTMEAGTLAAWRVRAGDRVRPGQVIAEIETDKATMELEAEAEGTIVRLLVPEGTEGVRVGTPIAEIAADADETEAGLAADAAAADSRADRGDRAPPPPPPAAPPPRGPAVPASGRGAGRPAPATAPGPAATRRMTVREALRDAMAEEMRRDPRVFVMGEEVARYQGAYKVTQGLLEEFGDKRVVDTPITEYGFAGLGVGSAMAGLRPIVEFMTFNFAMQAIDHIVNSAAKTLYMSGGQMRCPIVFRGPNGAAARVAAQHSQNFAPWYAQVPGLVVIAPYDAADAKGLLKAAIRCEDPVVFLENELLYGRSFEVPEGELLEPIGCARLRRAGRDVTLVSYSIGVEIALAAAGTLAEEGVEAEVLDLRTLRPIDEDSILASLARTHRMVVVEEGWPRCSIAAEVMAIAMEKGFDELDAPVLRVTDADVPLPYAANLEKAALVKPQDVVAAVRSIL